VNGHLEVAGADPLLYDFLQLRRRLSLLVHFISSLDRRERRGISRDP
jgi:hypothetical protein